MVWCSPGFRSWCHTFPSVLRRPAADHWEPRTLPTSVCWWLTDLRFLSSISIPGAAITHLKVHWSCRSVDAFKSSPAKCGEAWDPLVSYKWSTSPTATSSVPSTDFVTPSAAVRNLEILLDSDMSISSHVRKTVSTCSLMCLNKEERRTWMGENCRPERTVGLCGGKLHETSTNRSICTSNTQHNCVSILPRSTKYLKSADVLVTFMAARMFPQCQLCRQRIQAQPVNHARQSAAASSPHAHQLLHNCTRDCRLVIDTNE